MRHRRIGYAVTLGVVAVAYSTFMLDAYFDGQRDLTRLDALVLAAVCLAAVLLALPRAWRPPEPEHRRPSSIGAPRPPRQRPAEPPRLPPRSTALTETTQILPGAVMAAAYDAAQARVEPADSPVAVAEPESVGGDLGGLGLYLSGHAAGAHPEHDDGQRPDVDHLRGFAEGAVDRGREDDED